MTTTTFSVPSASHHDPPPQPYVDLRQESIIKRVLAKEILRQAFVALNLFATGGSDSVHGEFGRAVEWNQPAQMAPAKRTTPYDDS